MSNSRASKSWSGRPEGLVENEATQYANFGGALAEMYVDDPGVYCENAQPPGAEFESARGTDGGIQKWSVPVMLAGLGLVTAFLLAFLILAGVRSDGSADPTPSGAVTRTVVVEGPARQSDPHTTPAHPTATPQSRPTTTMTTAAPPPATMTNPLEPPTTTMTTAARPPATMTNPLEPPPATMTNPLEPPPATMTNPLEPPATMTNPLEPPATMTNPLEPPATMTNPLEPPATMTNPVEDHSSSGDSAE